MKSVSQSQPSHFIGVDLTRGISAGLFDGAGRLEGERYFSAFRPQEEISLNERLLSAIIGTLNHGAKNSCPVKAIGICGESPENEAAVGSWPALANPVRIHDLSRSIERSLGIPAFSASVADALALAEKRTRLGKKLKNFIYLWYGTSIRAGVFVDNALITGEKKAVGDLDRMIVQLEGDPCSQAGHKSLGELVGPRTIVQRAFSAIQQESHSLRRNLMKAGPDALDLASIARAAAREDQAARQILLYFNRYMAAALATLINFFAPEAVFWGGSAGRGAGGDYLSSLRLALEPFIWNSSELRLIHSDSGTKRRTWAAAVLAMQRLTDKESENRSRNMKKETIPIRQ